MRVWHTFKGPAAVLGIGLLAGWLVAQSGWDVALQWWLAGSPYPEFHNALRVFTQLGLGLNQGLACVALALALAVLARRQGQGWRQIATTSPGLVVWVLVPLILTGLVNTLLKIGFGRPRPKEMLWNGHDPNVWLPGQLDSSFWSFPSGHSASSMAIAVWLGFVFPTWRWPLLGLALLIACSRFLIVTPHYAGDVLAGLAVGGATAWAVWNVGQARGWWRTPAVQPKAAA